MDDNTGENITGKQTIEINTKHKKEFFTMLRVLNSISDATIKDVDGTTKNISLLSTYDIDNIIERSIKDTSKLQDDSNNPTNKKLTDKKQ